MKQNKSTKVDLKNETPADAKPVLSAGTGNLVELFAGSRSIGKVGDQDQFATTEIKIVITNLHQEEVRQERKGEKAVMNDLKFQESFVWRYFVVLADNAPISATRKCIVN